MSTELTSFPLERLYSANTYANSASSSPTAEELEALGYTVTDSSDVSDNIGLDFTDFLQLMVTQLQNQTMDNTADMSDMMNQLVQMSMVQMMTGVQTNLEALTEANTLSYAASLVGKTVTVGEYDENGAVKEVVGEVTGAGTYQDSPVIFVNDTMYPLNSIMAVGTLPEVPEASTLSSEVGEVVAGVADGVKDELTGQIVESLADQVPSSLSGAITSESIDAIKDALISGSTSAVTDVVTGVVTEVIKDKLTDVILDTVL